MHNLAGFSLDAMRGGGVEKRPLKLKAQPKHTQWNMRLILCNPKVTSIGFKHADHISCYSAHRHSHTGRPACRNLDG